ncbi:glutamine amidotransferase subunit PdxT [Striga asiatica]|uniref:Glutamine amidotransferase subunit PdxT n=1 Tax=Striga asiatica TaxID=4170 RepID=A0A5A7QSZ8_STRAF|nr:glutamine amidotransferase subunit PdxT [Striga asiatica]
MASRIDVGGISGFFTLLQTRNGYRSQLDNFKTSDMSYGEDVHVTYLRTLYYGGLLYRDICEPYMPACLGMIQTISPGEAYYKLDFSLTPASDGWKALPVLGCLSFLPYTPVIPNDVGATHTGYMDWHKKYSHPYVLPSECRSIETTNATTCLVLWVNKFRDATNEAIEIAMEADLVRAEAVRETVEGLMATFHNLGVSHATQYKQNLPTHIKYGGNGKQVIKHNHAMIETTTTITFMPCAEISLSCDHAQVRNHAHVRNHDHMRNYDHVRNNDQERNYVMNFDPLECYRDN